MAGATANHNGWKATKGAWKEIASSAALVLSHEGSAGGEGAHHEACKTVEGGLIIETHVDPLEPSRVTMLH